MRVRQDQSGFSVIEVLLALILVVLIVFVGYYVWHNSSEADKSGDSSQKIAQSSTKAAKQTSPAKVNPLLYKDNNGSLYSIAAEAKTADEKGIAKALDEHCDSVAARNPATADHALVAATGLEDLFKSTAAPHNFAQDGGFATVNTGCYDKTAGGAQWGNAAMAYLYKKDGTWTFLTQGQAGLDCEFVDRKGIKSTLLTTCFDPATGAERAPKPSR